MGCFPAVSDRLMLHERESDSFPSYYGIVERECLHSIHTGMPGKGDGDLGDSDLGQPPKEHAGSLRPPLLADPSFRMASPPFSGGGGGGMNGQMGGPRGPGLFNSPMQDRYRSDDMPYSMGDNEPWFGMGSNLSNGGIRGNNFGGGSGPNAGGPFMGPGGPGGPNSMNAMGQAAPGLPQQGAVLMVYGLNKDKMNADKLFNLLCLYGNVVRVKFLKTKEGCAMVQMGDASAVERSVTNLNNVSFFNNKMQLGYSKQAFLADVQQPYDLPDGSPSFKDYMGNKNNRFINPEMAAKNRIQPPSKMLHFFNTPPGLTEEMLSEVFAEASITPPKSLKLFPSKTDRSSSGLLEFSNMSEALEALVEANHAPIPNPNSKFPFIMKLCFSASRHIPNKMQE